MSSLRRAIRLAFWAAVAVSCSTWAQDIGSIYAANCANCHGADGRGDTALGRAMKLRDLRSPVVQKLSEDDLLVILSKGADRGRMPGFEKKLGAEAVRKLATYVRDIELQSLPVLKTNRTASLEASSDGGDVKSVFSAKCTHCHGADGAGNTVLGRALKLLDMRSPEAQKFSDNEMIAIIASGADSGRMPGFRKRLGPEMVEQLASYVRVLADKPPVVAAKKVVSTETASSLAASEPVKPAAQVEGKTISTVQAEKQMQLPDDSKAGDTHKASPFARLSSAIIPARKSGPGAELVDLNSASKETLMTLPGVTEADAASIIAGRPYKSSLQFKIRGIVAPETYAKITGRVVAKQQARTKQRSTANEDTQ